MLFRSAITFESSLDGNKKSIYNLNVSESETAGLFGWVSANSNSYTIKDLKIVNAKVVGGENVGILAGLITRPGSDISKECVVINCHVQGSVTANKNVGGIVGQANFLHMSDCSADIEVLGGQQKEDGIIGGVVGYGIGGSYTNCSAKGWVSGNWTVGGFGGYIEYYIEDGSVVKDVQVTNCSTSVRVTATNWNVGGFVGWTNTIISGCTASGNISSLPIWNSPYDIYRTGGFVGTNAGKISDSSYSGVMTYKDKAQYYGGFVGNDHGGTTINCRFDGSKNPALATNGLSVNNEAEGTNDIKNTLE